MVAGWPATGELLPGPEPPLPPPAPGPQGRQPIIVDVTTTELKIGDRLYYLENLDAGVVMKLMFNEEDRALLRPGFNQHGEHVISYRVVDIKPPRLMVTLGEYVNAPGMKPSEAYEYVRGWVEDTIAHPFDMVKDVIALYILYTWFHRFYQKKPFLIVTGFFGTGKSVVGNLLKAFGRYTVQTEPGVRTSEWELALLQGTMLVDEAESLKRRHLSLLRRLHDEGYTVSKMMGAPGGWVMLTLNLSAPVVLIGTHIPEDPALVSRGIVIKMHYGTPSAKPPTINSPAAREFRASALKMVVEHYSEYIGRLPEAEATGAGLTMRERDIYTPLCATALLAGNHKLCEEVKVLVKLSTYISQTLTPAHRLVRLVAKRILDKGERVGRLVRIPEPELHAAVLEYAKLYGVDPKDAAYVRQYFISAAYTREESGVTHLYFMEDDLATAAGGDYDDLLRRLGLLP